MKNCIYTLLLSLILLLQGCAFQSFNEDSPKVSNISPNVNYKKIYESLIAQYKEWKGVRYKYGGYTKKGIDCSAFVQRTFNEKLHFKLPRTTAMQRKVGRAVDTNRELLVTGDLIFFHTGFKTNHVGIYLKHGTFMHVSSRKGVIISRITNPYFSKHIEEIRRVLY